VAPLIGVDVGGTKIEAAVLSRASAGPGVPATGPSASGLSPGAVLERARVATPRDYGELLRAIADLVAALGARHGRPDGIGVGIPGSIGPATGLVRNANATALNGRALDADLSAALGLPVRIANDADCFALAEAVAGAGRGAETVLGLILGTGVGAGIVQRGRPLNGPNRITGEWGHVPLPIAGPGELPGPRCWCGRHGCVEAWCAGPALSRDHAARTGHALPAEAIAAAAQSGEPAAAESLQRHLSRLARGLAMVVNILDPDVIVLGGGLSNMVHLARDLPEAMRPHVFSDSFITPVRVHELGDSAGVIGAAWLWAGAPPPEVTAPGVA